MDGKDSTIEKTLSRNRNVIDEYDVDVVPLDSLGLKDVCFVKIYADGYTHQILVGAFETLKNSRFPPILLKINDNMWSDYKDSTLFGYLRYIGYNIFPIGGAPNLYLASDHPVRKQ